MRYLERETFLIKYLQLHLDLIFVPTYELSEDHHHALHVLSPLDGLGLELQTTLFYTLSTFLFWTIVNFYLCKVCISFDVALCLNRQCRNIQL